MSSYVILFVIVTRFFLKKMPKIFSYMLWFVVLFRLICPFSFQSIISLVPKNIKVGTDFITNVQTEVKNMSEVSETTVILNKPVDDKSKKEWNKESKFQNRENDLDTFIQEVNRNQIKNKNDIDDKKDKSSLGEIKQNSIDWLPIIITSASFIWMFGISGLILYTVFSTCKLKRKIRNIAIDKNSFIKRNKNQKDLIPVLEISEIRTAFVFGMVQPKIFLPNNLPEKEKQYILKHEEIHIRRYDYIIKPIAFFITCVHWFNPLVWVAYSMMSEDMELSCDECVIKELGSEIKKEYSKSLLNLSLYRQEKQKTFIQFGENNIKERVKNVLNYKKPAFAAMFIAIIIVVSIGFGLAGNPKSKKISNTLNSKKTAFPQKGEDSIWNQCAELSDEKIQVVVDDIKERMIYKYNDLYELGTFHFRVYNYQAKDTYAFVDIEASVKMASIENEKNSNFIKGMREAAEELTNKEAKQKAIELVDKEEKRLQTTYFIPEEENTGFSYRVKILFDESEEFHYQLYYFNPETNETTIMGEYEKIDLYQRKLEGRNTIYEAVMQQQKKDWQMCHYKNDSYYIDMSVWIPEDWTYELINTMDRKEETLQSHGMMIYIEGDKKNYMYLRSCKEAVIYEAPNQEEYTNGYLYWDNTEGIKTGCIIFKNTDEKNGIYFNIEESVYEKNEVIILDIIKNATIKHTNNKK